MLVDGRDFPPVEGGVQFGGRCSEVVVPLSSQEWVVLRAAWPLTAAGWERMLVVLEAMRPGLVKGLSPMSPRGPYPGPPAGGTEDRKKVT